MTQGIHSSQKGQTLVTLLIFVLMATMITTIAILIIATNSQTTMAAGQKIAVKELAESGVENALITLLRDDTYTGEVLPVDGNPVEIRVSGGLTDKTIIAKANLGDYSSTVEVTISFDNNYKLTVTGWREIY